MPMENGASGEAYLSDATAGGERKPAKVLFVDAQQMRRALALRFLNHHGYHEVILLPSMQDALEALSDGTVSIIIIQLGARRLAEDPIARQEIEALIAQAPSVPVMVISDFEDRQEILTAIKLHIRGYLPTSLSEEVALATIKLVEAGGSFAPTNVFVPSDAPSEEEPPPTNGGPPLEADSHTTAQARNGNSDSSVDAEVLNTLLSPRQLEVLRLMSMGQPNKSIAYKLCMTESTVKVHVRNIMRKLKVTNRTQAAYLASQF